MPIFNQALQSYNTNKSVFTIPKKGTIEYNEVMRIMRTLQSERPKKEPKPKAPKAPKAPPRKQRIEPIKTDTTVRG